MIASTERPIATGRVLCVELDHETGETRQIRALTGADRARWFLSAPDVATTARRLADAHGYVERAARVLIDQTAPRCIVEDLAAFADALEELIARHDWARREPHVRARGAA